MRNFPIHFITRMERKTVYYYFMWKMNWARKAEVML